MICVIYTIENGNVAIKPGTQSHQILALAVSVSEKIQLYIFNLEKVDKGQGVEKQYLCSRSQIVECALLILFMQHTKTKEFHIF